MSGPIASNLRRLAPAFVLLAASACGGRTTGTSQSKGCNDSGALRANGTTWTCSDLCNTCSCKNGEIASTEVACLRPEGGALSDAGLDATTRAEAEAGATGIADVATTDVDANDSAVEAGDDTGPEGGVDAALPPSCAPGGPGMTNCGPGGSGTESCCTSLEVTGGTYYRTYGHDGSGPTAEADPATVSGFRMDKYLVTVGRFRQFVNAWDGGVGYVPPAGSGKHTYLNGGNGLNATEGATSRGGLHRTTQTLHRRTPTWRARPGSRRGRTRRAARRICRSTV
jgi:formylglycine-generating enzyme